MKKKLLIALSIIVLLVSGLLLLTACDSDPENCEHEWGEWETTTEATCTSKGARERVCKDCETVDIEVLQKTKHQGGTATCSTLAKCDICGQRYGALQAHAYNVKNTDAIYKISDVSCTEAAVYYYSCSCGEKGTQTFTDGEPLEHNYIYISNEDGTHKMVCTNDAEHTSIVDCSGGSATCIDSAECEFCGEEYGTPHGHSWDKGVSAVSSGSACEAGGKILYTCTHCQTTKIELVDPVGHKYKSVVTQPNCLEKGYTTHYCLRCGNSYIDSEIAPTGKHSWDKELSCGSGRECTVCHTTEAALEHDYKLTATTAADCENPAISTYTCENCGDSYESVVKYAQGHTPDDSTLVEEHVSGCEYIQRYECETCGKTVDGEKVRHHEYTASITKEATCTKDGEKTYTCSKCGDTHKEVVVKSSKNHVWNSGAKNGNTITYTCTVCQDTKTVVDASGSDSANVNVDDIKTSGGVEFDEATLDMSELAGQGGVLAGASDITLSAGTLKGSELDSVKAELTEEQKAQLGDNPIYNFSISDSDGEISNFGDNYVTITIPYTLAEGEDVDSIAVWYMNGDELVSIEASYSNGYVTFKTNHFSYYTVTRLTPTERCELYGHNYSEKVVEKTCSSDGYTLKVCIRCRHSEKTDVVKTEGHNYVAATTPATCTTAGKATYTCANCGHSYEQKLPASGHNYTTEKKAATCSEEGYEKGVCDCGASYSIKISKLVHKFTSILHAATCEAGGYTEYACKNCDYSYTGNMTSALGHNMADEWEWHENYKKADLTLTCQNGCGLEVKEKNVKASEKDVDSTCYKQGRYECTVKYVYNGITYSDTHTEEKASVDHVFGDDWKHNKHGHWHSCSNCSGPSERFEHEFDKGTVTKAATCKSEGEMTFVCFCGEVKTEVIPRTNDHRFSNGVCVDCNSKEECSHNYGDGEVTAEPNCASDGVKTYRCTLCGGTKTEAIPSLGGHKFDDGEITTEATCRATGVKTFTCTVCGEKTTETLPMLNDHVYENGKCIYCGNKSDCEHKYNRGTVTKEATCTTEGSKTFTCEKCGGTKTEAIPSFGGHSYVNGSCAVCGKLSVDSFYLTLIDSFKTVNGFSVKINDVSFTINETDGSLINSIKLIGSVKQIDISEVCIYVEDGEIGGSAVGSFEIFSGPLHSQNAIYKFQALVEDGYVYAIVEYGGECNYTKASVDALIESLFEEMDLGGSVDTEDFLDFVKDTALPAIETLLDANSEKIDELLEKTFGIVFTVEAQDNGEFAVKLDCEKLRTLNEYFATKTVAEVVDIYYGEGAFDSLVEECFSILDLKISEIPDFVAELGLDADELIEKINDFAVMLGEADLDLDEILNDDKYANKTIGWLIEGDYSYAEEIEEELISELRNRTFYYLVAGRYASEVTDVVDGLIDALDNTVEFAFVTDEEGSISGLKAYVDSFDYSFDEYQVLANGKVDVVVNEKLAVNFTDIIEKVNSGIVMPDEEATSSEARTEYGSYSYGYLTYKGQSYTYEYALGVTSTKTLFDKLDYVSYSRDCQGFVRYEAAFTAELQRFIFANITVDGKSIYVIHDYYSGKTVELKGSAERFTAIFEDGTQKQIVMNSFDFYANVADAYLDVAYKVFGNTEGKLRTFYDYETYYYNKDLDEYRYESQHVMHSETSIEGDSCSDGRVTHYSCENCDYAYDSVSSWCNTIYSEIDLSDYSSCGTKIYGYACQYCGKIESIENISYNCSFSEDAVTDIVNGEGTVIGTKLVRTCTVCGLVFETENVYDTTSCERYESRSYKIYKGDSVIAEYSQKYSYGTNHNYEYVYELEGDSCEDGYTMKRVCKNCDYSVDYGYNYGHNYRYFNQQIACGGYIDGYICDVCKAGGDEYLNIYCYCGSSTVSEDGFDENGNYRYAYNRSCPVCGLNEEYEQITETVSGCESKVTETRVIYMNGELIVNYSRSYSSDSHCWEMTSYEIEDGRKCSDGYEAEYTCSYCNETRYEWNSGHIFETDTQYNLYEYGACGGYAETSHCIICDAKDCSFYTYCGYNSSYDYEYDGMTVTKEIETRSSYCCGIRWIKETSYDYSTPCSVKKSATIKCYAGETLICETEPQITIESTPHDYKVFSAVMLDGTCDGGYYAIMRCESCGDTYGRYGWSHNYKEIQTSFSELGLCGGYIYERRCQICEHVDYTNEYSYCSWSYQGTDEDGHSVYVCNNCNARRVSYSETSEKDENCRYTTVRYTVYFNANGDEVHRSESFSYNYEHNYEYDFTLFGDSCEEGYEVSYLCPDCGESYSNTNYWHETYLKESVNFSALGACGGYFEFYECACGEESYVNENCYCNFSSTSSSYVDNDGLTHQVYTYVCNVCGLTKVSDTYTVVEGCYNYEYRTVSYSIEDEEVVPSISYVYNTWENHDYEYSFILNGESCEDGYQVTRTCRDCGYSYTNNGWYHETFVKEYYDLEEYGACGGYAKYYACPCGKEERVDVNYWDCNYSYTSNKYYDDEGRLVNSSVYACERCGLRYATSYYTEKDYETCVLTYYYTVTINVGNELIANIQYTRSETSHDYDISATLEGDTCEDGVNITRICKDCGYEYTDRYTHHYEYEKERIELSEVCGGYATVSGCACGYYNNVSLSNSLCEFDNQYVDAFFEDVIPSGWYYSTNADNTSVYIDNIFRIYVCAVTDPEQCAYKIRYASYWTYDDGDGCTATRHVVYQFGYDEETGEYDYEVSYDGESCTVHRYVSESISETVDGNHVYGTLRTCEACGSYCYVKTYQNSNGYSVRREYKFENTLDDGNYKFIEEIYEFAGENNSILGNYETSYSYMSIDADGNEYTSSRVYEYDFDYVADFGENSYSQKVTYTDSDGYVSSEERGYTHYEGYTFETYYERTNDIGGDSENWYRYDYIYSFDGVCEKTDIYTNSNGEYSENTYEWHVTTNHHQGKYPTCTQDGEYYYSCPLCETVTSTYSSSPYGHSWYYTGDTYRCGRCGLENANGASGTIVMEDLTSSYGSGEYYVVGYWNQGSVIFSQYVSLILKTPMDDGNDEVILDAVEFTTVDGIRAIAFSKEAVLEMALELGYSSDEYDVRFNFVPDGDDSSFDYAITFTE